MHHVVEVVKPGKQTETPGWSQGGKALTDFKEGWLSSIAINNPCP